ncbi:MAG: hypothetical protein R3F60_31735 [bacterium]
MKDAPMEVAVAPVRQGEKLLGAVIVGYRLTFAAARRGKSLVDTEVSVVRGAAREPELTRWIPTARWRCRKSWPSRSCTRSR